MINFFKTLFKFVDLKWLSGRKNPEKFHEYSLVFVDNKQKNFFDQIEVFYKTGFLNKEKNLLIAKFYWDNYINISEAAKKNGIKVVFYLFYRQIPDLDGKLIFYPYNAQANCRLILNRNARHVFLTHGESNKKASINRMVRLYDYVIAAGNISLQRYLENKIFSSYDIKNGRVICVGSSLSADCFEYLLGNGTQPCVAYMPTWEGGLEEENFSSIAAEKTIEILCSILNGLRINKILIKFHPNTGSRIKSYKNSLVKLVEELIEKDVEVYIDPASISYFKRYPDILAKLNFDYFQLKIKYGVVDVSAAEFMLAAKKIPTVVLLRKVDNFFSSSEYMRIRKDALIHLDAELDLIKAISYLEKFNDEDEFLRSAFQVDKYFLGKNPKEIGELLINKLKNEMENSCEMKLQINVPSYNNLLDY